jgi:hypothetical protein
LNKKKERVKIQTIMRISPEGDSSYLTCPDCGKEVLEVSFRIVDGKLIYAGARVMTNCTSPCINKATHTSPVDPELIQPQTAMDQTIINVRLKP